MEGMRAIAVTLVVLSHAGMATLAGGYVGVDVFFVISGFLITTLLLKELDRTGTISLSGFYARRAVRLLPASALVLVATLAGAWFWLPSTRFHSISLDGLFATFYGINWRLADEGVDYLNADAAPSPLQHFWSLAVEEQFYLVWPLLMLIYAAIWARRRAKESPEEAPAPRTGGSAAVRSGGPAPAQRNGGSAAVRPAGSVPAPQGWGNGPRPAGPAPAPRAAASVPVWPGSPAPAQRNGGSAAVRPAGVAPAPQGWGHGPRPGSPAPVHRAAASAPVRPGAAAPAPHSRGYGPRPGSPAPAQHPRSLAASRYPTGEPRKEIVAPVVDKTPEKKPATRVPLTLALIVVAAVSLGASVTQTESAAPWAYFGAHTRVWELAVGALVAVAASRLSRLPGPFAALLTWAGVAAVITSAFVYDEHTAFPGTAALVPVLGSAAIIAGGCAAPRGSVAGLLKVKPFQLIGRYSYSWYLWHWPALMIGPAALGREPSLELGLALSAASLVVAVLSYHLVENPARNRPSIKASAGRGIAVGLVLSSVTAGIAFGAGRFTPPVETGEAVPDPTSMLAKAPDPRAALQTLLAESARRTRLPSNVRPAPQSAATDQPVIYQDKCHLEYEIVTADGPCLYGNPKGKDSIFLLGDSHAGHWFPAVDAVAKKRGLQLYSRTKSACPAPSVQVYNSVLKRAYKECSDWREKVLDEIAQKRPKFVVLSSNGGNGDGLVAPDGKLLDKRTVRDEFWVAAWTKTLDRIKKAGSVPVLLLDTPWPPNSTPDCMVTNPKSTDKCGARVAEAFYEPARRKAVAAKAASLGAKVIDSQGWFCTAAVCPPVVGNLLVWKDGSHISTAYSAALTPLLNASLPK
nr:SGNH hydrolase domain-containing protein [Couchioplanes caeruleus]